MKIGIIGLGYIGSITAAALAEAGYEILGVDIDRLKVESLAKAEPIIYEPELKGMLLKNRNKFTFSTDYSILAQADAIFVVVPTPTKDGKIYLEYVNNAVEGIKQVNPNAMIIIKSTVLPGTAKLLMEKTRMTIISNPEFTKEGTAIYDTLHPDRVVIGGIKKDAVEKVKDIWKFTNAPIMETTNENAEMIKYASNSFLAVKISFINQIANLCEKIPSCDVEAVARGMGFDKRIAPYFLKAGIGFGGSCFPKDTTAFISFAKGVGEDLSIVESALEVNRSRVERVTNMLDREFKGREKRVKIAILGLTFKADTDDVRESQAIKLASMLKVRGYQINAYDPMAKTTLEGIRLFANAKDCIADSDAVVIATEWGEFKDLIIKDKFTIDMKRILNPANVNRLKAVGLYG